MRTMSTLRRTHRTHIRNPIWEFSSFLTVKYQSSMETICNSQVQHVEPLQQESDQLEGSNEPVENAEPLTEVLPTPLQPVLGGSDSPVRSENTENQLISLEAATAQYQEDRPFLLYKDVPYEHHRAVAIARRVQRETVHGKKLLRTEGAFEVIEPLDESELGPDDEPLAQGVFLTWPLNCTSSTLGRTIEEVKFRIPGKMLHPHTRHYVKPHRDLTIQTLSGRFSNRNYRNNTVLLDLIARITDSFEGRGLFQGEVIEGFVVISNDIILYYSSFSWLFQFLVNPETERSSRNFTSLGRNWKKFQNNSVIQLPRLRYSKSKNIFLSRV